MLYKPKTGDELLKCVGPDAIAQLRTASGASEDSFNQLYLPLLVKFAEYVQETPVEAEVYNQPLGAIRLGITSAFFTLRLSGQVIFIQGTSQERRTLNPQYLFAAFSACLASVVLLVNHNLILSVGGERWSYLSAEPNLFKASSKVGGYEIGWTRNQRKASSALGVLVLAQFYTSGMWSQYAASVASDMCAAINPSGVQVVGETALMKVVRQGMDKARELELRGKAGQYMPPANSQPSALLIFNADDASTSLSLQPTKSPFTDETESASDETVEIKKQSVKKPNLSQELKAWASHIRSNAPIQEHLELEPDGTLKFDLKYLSGSGLRANEIFDHLKNGNFIQSTENLPHKHLVLKADIAAELKVEV